MRLKDLGALQEAWPGSELLTLRQAHFGYGMIPRAMAWLRERELFAVDSSAVDFSIAGRH